MTASPAVRTLADAPLDKSNLIMSTEKYQQLGEGGSVHIGSSS
jgi:hypothetical protein